MQVGFGALALFTRLNEEPRRQPSSADESDVALNLGSFQLPIVIGFYEDVAALAGGRVAEKAPLARHAMARHGMAWHGTAWHGMARHGMGWHGMA